MISLTPAVIELIAVMIQGTIMQLFLKYPKTQPSEDEVRAQIAVEKQRNNDLMTRVDALEGGE